MEETAGGVPEIQIHFARGFTKEQVHLASLLGGYQHTIAVTRKLLERVPTAVLPRVGWDQVVGMARMFVGEATRVGKIWTEDVSDSELLAENMQEYFGLLQRVLMLAHAATRDAGSTLKARVRTAMSRLLDVSSSLIKEALFSYVYEEIRLGDTIPKLIASVWESFFALQRIPSNNVTAIGEALGQVAFSVEKNLQIMKELNEASSDDPSNEVEDKPSGDIWSNAKEVENGSCDPPEKLKDSDTEEMKKGSCNPPEEMDIALLTTDAVSAIHDMLIHLSPVVIGLMNKEREGTMPNFVDSLENILKLSKVIESQTEAFVHPDHDISAMRVAARNIYNAMREMTVTLHQVGGHLHYSPEFYQAWAKSIQLIRHLGADQFKKSSGADDHLLSRVEKLGLQP